MGDCAGLAVCLHAGRELRFPAKARYAVRSAVTDFVPARVLISDMLRRVWKIWFEPTDSGCPWCARGACRIGAAQVAERKDGPVRGVRRPLRAVSPSSPDEKLSTISGSRHDDAETVIGNRACHRAMISVNDRPSGG
jgi:hypothetical protein